MQISFGVGLLTLTPSGSNPTPQQVAVLQDVSVDIAISSKELYGSYQFPIDVARAAGKISGKAKFAAIRGSLFQQFFGGSTIATGQTIGVQNEVGTIPLVSTYTITTANAANFTADLGVFDTVTGLFMSRVASGPTTGQYSVASGIYTFAAADAGHLVWLSYDYTNSAIGKTVSLTNQLMGTGNTFGLTLFNSFRSMNTGIKLYAVQVPKLSLALKNEDYTMSDLDFDAFANSTGQVIDLYTTE